MNRTGNGKVSLKRNDSKYLIKKIRFTTRIMRNLSNSSRKWKKKRNQKS